jgi:hypothetical protein
LLLRLDRESRPPAEIAIVRWGKLAYLALVVILAGLVAVLIKVAVPSTVKVNSTCTAPAFMEAEMFSYPIGGSYIDVTAGTSEGRLTKIVWSDGKTGSVDRIPSKLPAKLDYQADLISAGMLDRHLVCQGVIVPG